MNFLPCDDLEYLKGKAIRFELVTEQLPGGNVRQGIILPDFRFEGNLCIASNGQLTSTSNCDLLIVIVKGYATTKLDSFYTSPRLKRPDGSDPDRANREEKLFDRVWQFWSRHLSDSEWRPGIDGLETYLPYIRSELKKA